MNRPQKSLTLKFKWVHAWSIARHTGTFVFLQAIPILMETYEWHKYFCRSLFVIKNVEAIGSRDQFRFEEIIDSHISIHSLVVACSETSISWCFWIYTWTTCTLYFYGSIFTRLFGYMLNIALSFHHSPCKGPFEYNFLKTYCMSYLTLWMQSTNVIQKERPPCCWSEKKKPTHYPLPESDAVTTQTCAPYYGDEIINTISS